MKSAKNWGRLGMKFDVVQLESTGIDVIDGDRGKNYPHQNELLSTGFCLFLSAKNVTKSGFSFSETQFDLYNINEATLFPELEHQLSYIKYINSGNVQAVSDFEKYDTHTKADSTPQNLDDESLNTYILSNLSNLLSGIAKPEEIEDLKGIIQSSFAVDWYNRDAIISKLRMSISGYYFVKLKDKKEAKEKAVQITARLRQAVNDYMVTNIKGGE